MLVITIIGVVASLTIPNMIQNIQDQQYKTALKKNYSVLANATISVAEENGGTLVGLPVTGWVTNSLISYYYKYLNVIKQCTHANTKGNCWHNDFYFSYLNGDPVDPSDDWWAKVGIGVILTDGTLVQFYDEAPDCDFQTSFGTPADKCTFVTVDVNGFKRPNTYGKDIYVFYILKNRVIPRGISGADWIPAGDCTSSGQGMTCANSKLLD